ncbi:IS3 family transposase [Kaistia granuli]|uniref:IS3 family transposase n=1 Tax=Kaistia granuli TaxID=363259 RepID=UPI000362DC61
MRLVPDHEHEHHSRWSIFMSISSKLGCTGRPERVGEEGLGRCGKRAGVPTDMAAKLKALERENRELRQANQILRKASAYFAHAELDRPFKR